MTHRRLRRGLVWGGLLVALSSSITLAFASQRITAEQAAFRAPAVVSRCAPSTLNRSAVLPGTSLAVNPLPGLVRLLPADADQPAGRCARRAQRGHRERIAEWLACGPPEALLAARRCELRPLAAVPVRRDGDRPREAQSRLALPAVRLPVRDRPPGLPGPDHNRQEGRRPESRCSTSALRPDAAPAGDRGDGPLASRPPPGTCSPLPTPDPGRAGR